mmetsp:Transcript_25995/g.38668  ORF Transcript_25995/g.38668 Transcript_25995/m.38668 type:complete len:255 (-) Transcript_25995:345-1109(-)
MATIQDVTAKKSPSDADNKNVQSSSKASTSSSQEGSNERTRRVTFSEDVHTSASTRRLINREEYSMLWYSYGSLAKIRIQNKKVAKQRPSFTKKSSEETIRGLELLSENDTRVDKMRAVNDSILEAYMKQRVSGNKDAAKLSSLYHKSSYPMRKEALERAAKDEGEMRKVCVGELKALKKEKRRHKSPAQLILRRLTFLKEEDSQQQQQTADDSKRQILKDGTERITTNGKSEKKKSKKLKKVVNLFKSLKKKK